MVKKLPTRHSVNPGLNHEDLLVRDRFIRSFHKIFQTGVTVVGGINKMKIVMQVLVD